MYLSNLYSCVETKTELTYSYLFIYLFILLLFFELPYVFKVIYLLTAGFSDVHIAYINLKFCFACHSGAQEFNH